MKKFKDFGKNHGYLTITTLCHIDPRHGVLAEPNSLLSQPPGFTQISTVFVLRCQKISN